MNDLENEINSLRTRLNESETKNTSNVVRLNAEIEELTLNINQSKIHNRQENDEENEKMTKDIENGLKKEINIIDGKLK